MERACGRAIVAAAVTVGVLAGAPGAMADVRYAEPAGDGPPASCLQSDPCAIQDAIEDASVMAGDEIVVLQGNYPLATDALDVDAAITVRGGAGTSLPRITRAGNAFRVNVAGATVRDLQIESTSGSQTLSAVGGSTLERLVLVARQPADYAAVLNDGALLRDSVAWSDFQAGVTTGGSGATLVNVTAIGAGASSDGVQADAFDSSTQTVTLLNVIARGTAEGIRALDEPGADNVDVNVFSSNYSSFDDASPDAVVNLGPGNQTAAPSFAAPAALDFHQLRLADDRRRCEQPRAGQLRPRLRAARRGRGARHRRRRVPAADPGGVRESRQVFPRHQDHGRAEEEGQEAQRQVRVRRQRAGRDVRVPARRQRLRALHLAPEAPGAEAQRSRLRGSRRGHGRQRGPHPGRPPLADQEGPWEEIAVR